MLSRCVDFYLSYMKLDRTFQGAISCGLGIAIRGGNHGTHDATWPKGGVLVRTDRMSYVWVDKDSMVVHVGAGARNGHVQDALNKYVLTDKKRKSQMADAIGRAEIQLRLFKATLLLLVL
jgi:hypothetical protein